MLGYDLVLAYLDVIIVFPKLITPGFWVMMRQKIILGVVGIISIHLS